MSNLKIDFGKLNLELEFDEYLDAIGVEMLTVAREKAPTNTGTYKKKLAYKKKKNSVALGAIAPSSSLVHILEKGTHGERSQPAQPHITPAFEAGERLAKTGDGIKIVEK